MQIEHVPDRRQKGGQAPRLDALLRLLHRLLNPPKAPLPGLPILAGQARRER